MFSTRSTFSPPHPSLASIRGRKGRFILAVCALLVFGCSDPSFEEADRAREAYREQLLAFEQAIASGNQAAIQSANESLKAALDHAREAYERAGAETARDPVVAAGYADILLQSGQFDLAAKMYQRGRGAYEKEPLLWLNLGKALARINDATLPDAKAALERCLELGSRPAIQAEAHKELAGVYEKMGLYEFAKGEYGKALALAPDDKAAVISLAALKAREGAVLEASRDLDVLGPISPEYAPVLQEKFGKAIADFQRARLWITDTAEGHFAYGRLALLAGLPNDALLAVERSLELDDSRYPVWNLLGSLARQTGDTERARQAYRKSLELNPDQPLTRQYLDSLGDPNA